MSSSHRTFDGLFSMKQTLQRHYKWTLFVKIKYFSCTPALYKTIHDCTSTSCSCAGKKKEVSADSLWLSENSPVLIGMISGMLCTINVYSSSQLDWKKFSLVSSSTSDSGILNFIWISYSETVSGQNIML